MARSQPKESYKQKEKLGLDKENKKRKKGQGRKECQPSPKNSRRRQIGGNGEWRRKKPESLLKPPVIMKPGEFQVTVKIRKE